MKNISHKTIPLHEVKKGDLLKNKFGEYAEVETVVSIGHNVRFELSNGHWKTADKYNTIETLILVVR